jgi:hypothetical protein
MSNRVWIAVLLRQADSGATKMKYTDYERLAKPILADFVVKPNAC